jgi:transposase-like protein
MSEDEAKEVLACPSCGATMRLARITPKFGGLPKLKTFQCVGCNDVLTLEDEG